MRCGKCGGTVTKVGKYKYRCDRCSCYGDVVVSEKQVKLMGEAQWT